MFGNLIYYNKTKIDQYTALITGNPIKPPEDSSSDNQKKKINYLLECNQFEQILKERDDYVDFIERNVDINIKDVKIASIIKVAGEIYVPEEFDMVQLIEAYKPLILSNMSYKDVSERQIIDAVFNSSKMNVPIFCELSEECDFWLGIGKASQENLLADYNELEDFEGKSVTIFAKLEARKYFKDTPLKVFDIYKDFLGLNRALRKKIITQKENDFESIEIREDYLGLELLAIY